VREPRRAAGTLELAKARVRWFLSTEQADLQRAGGAPGRSTYRSIVVDSQAVEFSEGFADLHTRVYEETLAGRGFGIADARPSIALCSRIRKAPMSADLAAAHPLVPTQE
jgi:UDP-N-acetyl-2-amino-2-deoxyglucuronate dehydrogenase